MYNLSADISSFAQLDFAQGLGVAEALSVNNIEVSSFSGEPAEALSPSAVEDLRAMLIDTNKRIVLLSTSLSPADESGFRRLFRNAHLLHVENVNMRIAPGAALCEPEAFAAVAKMAESWGVGLCVENHHATPLSDNDALTAFFARFPGGGLRLVFNPLEFVALGRHPFFHMFYNSRLKNSISFLRLTDGLYSTGERTALCRGNGEVKELISILLARSFEGYFSLTPEPADKTGEGLARTLAQYRAAVKAL